MKRLMHELQTYQTDPNEALLELGPENDDVMHWRAVMKGVVGTAYEGTFTLHSLYLNTQKRIHIQADEHI